MNNRLQFRHHGTGSGYTLVDGVFDTREDAIWYVKHDIRNADEEVGKDAAEFAYSLYGEPTVLRYKNEDDETDPNVILVIGSMTNSTELWRENRFCFIDPKKTEKEIEALWEELEKAIKSLSLIVNDSDTLDLHTEHTESGTVLSGDVKVAEAHLFDGERELKDNNIIKTEDGIFTFIGLDYDNESGILKFTVNDTEKEFQLGINYVVSGYYSERDESIHLKMKQGDDIVISLEKLISEWVVEGEAANSPIILNRQEVGYGGDAHVHVEPWQDILSADVRIAEDRVNNILEKTSDNRYLYVDGVASNIAYYKNGEKTNVKEVLDDLTKIKLSSDSNNILVQKVDGFFAASKLEYISNENTLVFTVSSNDSSDKKKETRIKLNTFKLFERIQYDPAKEALVITYIDGNGQVQFVEIPIGEMMQDWEWDVNNYGHSVFLQKDRMVQGADQLSADVKISPNEDNILVDDNHELYVKGTADNIKYGEDSNVKAEIDALKTSDAAIISMVEDEVERSTEEDERLQGEIDDIAEDVASKLESVRNTDHSIDVDVTDAINPVIKVNLGGEEPSGDKNIIKLNNDGLFAMVDLDYEFESGTSKNVLIFKTTNGAKRFDLKTNSVVDRIYYDSSAEEIVIEYTVNGHRMPDVRIPVRDMIDEIDVQSTSSVKMTKTKNPSAGSDILSSEVILNTIHSDNILVDDGGLYVSGAQIEANKNAITALDARVTAAEETLEETSEGLADEVARSTAKDAEHDAAIAANTSAIANETTRATNAENVLQTSLNNEVTRAMSAETVLSASIATLDHKVDDEIAAREAGDATLTASVSDLNTRLTAEVTRSTEKDTALQSALTQEVNDRITAVSNEQNRATSAETALQTALNSESVARVNADDNLESALSAEVSRAQAAEQANASAIASETDRATAAETNNASDIAAEVTRATTKENAIEAALNDEIARSTDKDTALQAALAQEVNDRATSVAAETTRATSAETALQTALNSESVARVNADDNLESALSAEVSRAKAAEQANADAIAAETTRATAAEAANANAIAAEVTRATSAEEANADAIATEKARAEAAEEALEDAIEAIEQDYAIDVANTNTVTLEKIAQTSGSLLKASVNINADATNTIKETASGIFSTVDLTYDSTTNKLTFVTTNGSKEIALTSNSVIDNIYYDSTTESIVIQYTVNGHRMPDVIVPVRSLINEIDVVSTSSVALTKTIGTSGRPDVITADVVINSVHDDNMLVNDGGLYVSGAQVEANKNAIEALETASQETRDAVSALSTRLDGEISRATAAEQANASAIASETDRATAAETNNSRDIAAEVTRATTKENAIEAALNDEIARSTDKDTALQSALTQEVNDRTTSVAAETTRATSAETALQTALSSESVTRANADDNLESALNAEVSRAKAAEQANADAIAAETTRATAAETNNARDIAAEVTRATTKENAIEAALNDEIARSTGNDTALQAALAQEVNDRATSVAAETTRATSAETALQTALNSESVARVNADGNLESALNAEVSRAKAAEQANADAITAETARATAAETANANAIQANATAITNEVARAQAAEQTNATAIATEKSRAELAEANISNAVSAETARATAAEAALDAKIDAKTFEIITEDSATLDLSVVDGNKISGNVLVANGSGNIIKASSDTVQGTGIYASVDLSYDAATNKLTLTTTSSSKEIALSIGSILKSIEYDPIGKNLIIKYDTNSGGQIIEQTITVPVEDLFNDWTVHSGDHLGAIILKKEEGTSGSPDVLSAEVVISTLADNILVNDQGALYVSSSKIDGVEERVDEIQEELDKSLVVGETSTLTLNRDSSLKLTGDVKLSSDSQNLIRIDGNNGLMFNGNIDCGEY